MGSEGRVMVVKFPYSSMKTVPKVDTDYKVNLISD